MHPDVGGARQLVDLADRVPADHEDRRLAVVVDRLDERLDDPRALVPVRPPAARPGRRETTSSPRPPAPTRGLTTDSPNRSAAAAYVEDGVGGDRRDDRQTGVLELDEVALVGVPPEDADAVEQRRPDAGRPAEELAEPGVVVPGRRVRRSRRRRPSRRRGRPTPPSGVQPARLEGARRAPVSRLALGPLSAGDEQHQRSPSALRSAPRSDTLGPGSAAVAHDQMGGQHPARAGRAPASGHRRRAAARPSRGPSAPATGGRWSAAGGSDSAIGASSKPTTATSCGHPPAGVAQRLQRAERHQVVGAEDRVDVGLAVQQGRASPRLAALLAEVAADHEPLVDREAGRAASPATYPSKRERPATMSAGPAMVAIRRRPRSTRWATASSGALHVVDVDEVAAHALVGAAADDDGERRGRGSGPAARRRRAARAGARRRRAGG